MAITKILGAAVVLGMIGSGGSFAQTVVTTPSVNPPVVSLSVNSPVVSATSPDSKTTAAPVAGANSFTETQARSRLEAHGYSNVSGLTKDDQSIWRGKATKNGTLVSVALDYQGNIVPSK
jgi:chemotaxis response regulator CheB